MKEERRPQAAPILPASTARHERPRLQTDRDGVCRMSQIREGIPGQLYAGRVSQMDAYFKEAQGAVNFTPCGTLLPSPKNHQSPPQIMSISTDSISAKVIEVLKTVSETDEVEKNLDLALYDSQVLDSMKTVELIVAIGAEFGVDISPAEFERDKWATPRMIIADIENRLAM